MTLDAEASFGVGGRILRCVGAMNVVVANAAIPPTLSLLHIFTGFAMIDQDLGSGLNIADAAQADRRFCIRQNLGGYPEGTGISGAVGTYSWTHRFDWLIRQGKGIAMRKDNAFVLCTGTTGLIAGSSVGVSYCFNMLFETGP